MTDGWQPSFTDVEYGQRRRVTRREKFLTMMDEVIPWPEWVELIRPVYYDKKRGRLNIISHLLSLVPYDPLVLADVKLPKRQKAEGYVEPQLPLRYVPEKV